MRPGQRRAPVGLRALVALCLSTSLGICQMPGLAAQERPPGVPPAQAAPPPAIDVSPRGAFLRALLVPGWGHTVIGSYNRGGFYFAAQTATAYTYLRTRRRLAEVRERVAFRERIVEADLAGRGITDSGEIEAAMEADEALSELRRLEEARADQQEDIVALGIFILFLSGADAYVSAHLARFPDPLEFDAEPVGGGRFELALKLRAR